MTDSVIAVGFTCERTSIEFDFQRLRVLAVMFGCRTNEERIPVWQNDNGVHMYSSNSGHWLVVSPYDCTI